MCSWHNRGGGRKKDENTKVKISRLPGGFLYLSVSQMVKPRAVSKNKSVVLK